MLLKGRNNLGQLSIRLPPSTRWGNYMCGIQFINDICYDTTVNSQHLMEALLHVWTPHALCICSVIESSRLFGGLSTLRLASMLPGVIYVSAIHPVCFSVDLSVVWGQL